MSASIYDDKLIEPNERMLSLDLENSIDFLNKIREYLEIEYGNLKLSGNIIIKNLVGF